MKDFIINLYANKYFPIYLGVVIIVLLIAFFVVFFLGKKDQKKIEETQRLNAEAIKKASEKGSTNVNNTVNSMPIINATTPVVEKTATLPKTPVPQTKPITNVAQTTSVTMSKVEQAPIATSSAPMANQVKPNEVKQNPVITENVSSIPKNIPVMEPKVEQIKTNMVRPIVTEPVKVNEIPKIENKVSNEEIYRANSNDIDKFKNLASSIDKDLTELENMKQNVSVNNNFSSEVANNPTNTKVVNNIYSSVYVPKKEEPIKEEVPIEDDDFDFEETMSIELPKLKDDK